LQVAVLVVRAVLEAAVQVDTLVSLDKQFLLLKE
jgi:hypothetical protein